MKTEVHSPARLTDDQLLIHVKALATCEREATARLIASLAELDARRLYLGEGYSSLFTYGTQCRRLAEHAAYGRIEAARAAQKFPVILEQLADGALNLTSVCLLARHLTAENHERVLEAARHKSKREVEQQVAALHPRPDAMSMVRKLPVQRMTPREPTPLAIAVGEPAGVVMPRDAVPDRMAVARRHSVVAPLAPERYKVQFTVSRDAHDKLRKVQDLLRHSIPDGDVALIFERAVTLLLADLGRNKVAKTDRPRPRQTSAP